MRFDGPATHRLVLRETITMIGSQMRYFEGDAITSPDPCLREVPRNGRARFPSRDADEGRSRALRFA